MTDEPQALYRLTVEGDPQPKQRPRVVMGGTRTYTPAATVKAEADLAMRFRHAYPGVVEDAVTRFALRVLFYVRSRRRCDLDNRVKLIADGLNHVVWQDDAQIDELHALVVHGARQPRTEIEIYRKRPEWR